MNPPNFPVATSVPESRSPLDPLDAIIPLAPQPRRALAPPNPSRVDLLLASFVVLLAFFVASTPARNSDLWLHLATGRALADGSYRFQGDPFTQDTHAWIAHSWLYDLLAYEIFTKFSTFGGTVLVVLKASLFALLAGLLVRLGARAQGLVWPTLAVALSVLALSGRLLLQPALVSAVLLAVTLWLLERGRWMRADKRAGWLSAYGPIVPMFALWANLDDWFLLGPLTVGLYLLGDLLAAVGGDANRADLPGLTPTLGVGLLACLLTPFHIHGLTVPAELGLSATAHALKADPLLRNLFVSPFDGMYFHFGRAWSISGLAYSALVLLGGLSFLASRDAWRGRRLPVWLGFFALSAWSVYALPFFAVASAPILALNVQDFTIRSRPDWLHRNEFLLARSGRAAALVLLLGLLVAAWPGWLQSAPYEMRRWVVLEDPSLRRAAEKLAEWRKQDRDRLGVAERGFNFSPRAANYLAWFCPEEKGVLDGRLHVSATEAEEYVRVRKALVEGKDAENSWRKCFRARGINHVILEDIDRRRTSRAFQRMMLDSSEWFLMSLTGNTTIFGWNDPQKRVPSPQCARFSVEREAYHPIADELAPARGLEDVSESSPWWSGFVAQQPAGHPDRDAAALLLLYFDTLQSDSGPRKQRIWEVGCIASTIAEGGRTLSAQCQQCLALNCFAVARLSTSQQMQAPPTPGKVLAYQLQNNFFLSQDDAPSELLFLALRAAWRGARLNPDDAPAHALLGNAYLRLARSTRERVVIDSNRMPFLRRLRAVQAAAAYNRALRIDPDLLEAHVGLVFLYERFDLLDLTLHHLREELRILRVRNVAAGEGQDRMISALEERIRSLEERQEKARYSYDIGAAKVQSAVERAKIAQDRGLAETALQVLLASDVAAFGREGVEMELGLLLITGRVQLAREWLLPEHRSLLGAESYRLYRLQLAAAVGDYEQADDELAEMLAAAERPIDYYTLKATVPQALALAFGQVLLEGRTEWDSLPQRKTVYDNRQKLSNLMMEYLEVLVKSSNIRTMRAMLDVERGNVGAAEVRFREALLLYSSGSGIDFDGRGLAEYFHARLR